MGRIASAGHADYVREEETVGLETVPYSIECPTSKADIALESDVPQRAQLTGFRPSVYTVSRVWELEKQLDALKQIVHPDDEEEDER